MKTIDFLKRDDSVTTTIFGSDGKQLYRLTDTGYRSIEEAIKDAITNADLKTNPEDCVFEIDNRESGVSHRYRLNAHGNVKLIV